MSCRAFVNTGICLLISALAGCAAHSEAVAGFDGHWTAQIPVQGRCPAASWQFDVKGADLSGTATNPGGSFALTGTVDGAGKGTIKINQMGGTIQFSASQFASDYFNSCGPRHASGSRS